ncbi:MAG: hypothetical protein QG610_2475, partial [Euryarchaeota archaeon]|nr:hypothetical protein [Euryarchaeota archaeon]
AKEGFPTVKKNDPFLFSKAHFINPEIYI